MAVAAAAAAGGHKQAALPGSNPGRAAGASAIYERQTRRAESRKLKEQLRWLDEMF